MVRIEDRRVSLLICVALIGVTVAVFWPVWTFDFIGFDDPMYVKENPEVLKGLSWENVGWALKTGYASNWHPITWLSLMLDVQLFGPRPGMNHLINLLFHIANVVLLFLTLRRVTGALWRSAFVAALFGIHPLHVESVAWIAERKDVLSGFFFILTILAYAKYVTTTAENRKQKAEIGSAKHGSVSAFRSWYVLALVLFALGLMSKPMLVTVPFVLLLLDFWPFARFPLSTFRPAGLQLTGSPGSSKKSGRGLPHSTTRREAESPNMFRRFWSAAVLCRSSQSDTPCLNPLHRLLVEKIPFLALSAVSCAVTMIVQTPAMIDPNALPLPARLGNAALTCLDYLRDTFWPARLAVFYPYPMEIPEFAVTGAVVLMLAVTTAALLLARRTPYLPIGWFWYLGMLVPVIGIVQVGSQARADRYTYLPLIGIFIVLTWAAAALASKRKASRLLLAPAGALVIAALAITAHRQAQHWRNTETIYAHAAKVTDDNYVAVGGMGIAQLVKGDYDHAMTNLYTALELARRHGAEKGVKYYIGAGLQMQGRGLEALPWLEDSQVVPEIRPQRSYRLGLSLIEAGRLPEAETALKDALSALPQNPDFRLGMAALHHQQSNDAQAEVIYKELIAAHSELAVVHKSYADLLVLGKRPAEAAVQYAAAVKGDPSVRVRRAYASTLAQLGRTSEAIEQLKEALKIEPKNADINLELADLVSQAGQNREAIVFYDKALSIEPKQISALNNLAWILATCSDDKIREGKRAVELAERACQLTEWKSFYLIGTLAAAYAEAGNFPEAIAAAEKAIARARLQNLKEPVERNQQLLELYRAGKPYREPAGR